MTELEEINPNVTDLLRLVTVQGAVFMQGKIFELNYKFTLPVTMNLPNPKSYPNPLDESAGSVDPFHVEASVEPTPPESSLEPFPVEVSSKTKLDGTDDGIPPIRPTPHIVLGMIYGEMPEYLRSFQSPTQLWKGLLDYIQTFLAFDYREIMQPAMKVLPNYTRTLDHIL